MMSADVSEMSLKDKRKFFEQEIAASASKQPRATAERKFSYLQEHEVANLKHEDEHRVKSGMSQDEILKTLADGLPEGAEYDRMITSIGNGEPDMVDIAVPIEQQEAEEEDDDEDDARPQKSREREESEQLASVRLVSERLASEPKRKPLSEMTASERLAANRTGSLERRKLSDKQKQKSQPIKPSNNKIITEDRSIYAVRKQQPTIKAEHKAALRKERMKSLEDEALRAQTIIANLRELQDADLDDFDEVVANNESPSDNEDITKAAEANNDEPIKELDLDTSISFYTDAIDSIKRKILELELEGEKQRDDCS